MGKSAYIYVYYSWITRTEKFCLFKLDSGFPLKPREVQHFRPSLAEVVLTQTIHSIFNPQTRHPFSQYLCFSINAYIYYWYYSIRNQLTVPLEDAPPIPFNESNAFRIAHHGEKILTISFSSWPLYTLDQCEIYPAKRSVQLRKAIILKIDEFQQIDFLATLSNFDTNSEAVPTYRKSRKMAISRHNFANCQAQRLTDRHPIAVCISLNYSPPERGKYSIEDR